MTKALYREVTVWVKRPDGTALELKKRVPVGPEGNREGIEFLRSMADVGIFRPVSVTSTAVAMIKAACR